MYFSCWVACVRSRPMPLDPRDGAVRFRVAPTLRVGDRLLMSLALICGAKGRRET
jgi:hypothetical protein